MSTLLKKLNEKTPDGLKRMLAPIIKNKLVKNKIFLEQYEYINKFDNLTCEEQINIQTKKLKDILIHSYETTSYYKNLFDKNNFNPYEIKKLSDISRLPILTKEIVRNNFENLISNTSIKYYIAKTGGTTGTPLKLLMDSDSIYKERAFVYSYWSKLGFDYNNSRLITFRGVDIKGKVYKINPIYNEIILSPFYINNDRIQEYVQVINKFKPNYFTGYPSAISSFCKMLKVNNIKLDVNIDGVFFISEEVSDRDRRIVEEVLGCKTMTFYGHSERSVLAGEYEGVYKFNSLYGYTELIPTNKDNEFEILCTGFINKKMPLIRYSTGDIAIKTDKGYEIKGRSNNMFIIGRNNEHISMASKVFHEGLFTKVIAYQFIQDKIGEVKVNVMVDPLNNGIVRNLENQINNSLKDIVTFKVYAVNNLELTPRGKFKILLQNVKR